MKRGTTPVITVYVSGCDLRKLKKIIVTFAQGDIQIDKESEEMEIEETVLRVSLTQEETLMLNDGKVSAQLRAIDEYGRAIASDICDAPVDRILKDGVIS